MAQVTEFYGHDAQRYGPQEAHPGPDADFQEFYAPEPKYNPTRRRRRSGRPYQRPEYTFRDPTRPTPISQLDTWSAYIDCPWCQSRSPTKVKKENGHETRKLAKYMMTLALVGGFMPLLWHWYGDLGHYCETCGRKVAVQEYVVEEMGHGPSIPAYPGDSVRSNGMARQKRGLDRQDSRYELQAKPNGVELEGNLPRAEMADTQRHEADGSAAVSELGPAHTVYELEHVDQDDENQRRIRARIENIRCQCFEPFDPKHEE